VTASDNSRLLNSDGTLRLPHLAKELTAANDLTLGHVDVTEHVQQRVESCGGGEITFTVDEDLAATFSANPNKGSPKQLRVSLTVLGHDSERMTLSDEIT